MEKSTPAIRIDPAKDQKINEIAKGICDAMAGVQQLGKDSKNNFDKYDFVSIDKFLKLVNPLCAKNGLFAAITLIDHEPYVSANKKSWMRYFFTIRLCHTSGQSISVDSMVSVPASGAQASGSAQSYALKQFWRGLLNIPTGDKDEADFKDHENSSNTPEETIGEARFVTLQKLIVEAGADEDKIREVYGVQLLEEFPLAKFDTVMKQLRSKIARAQPAIDQTERSVKPEDPPAMPESPPDF